MWLQKARTQKKPSSNGLVAVAIDKDKGSQYAIKWASEHLLSRGNTVILIHVNPISVHRPDANGGPASPNRQRLDRITRELFMSFHCYCTRKDIRCYDVILKDTDVVKALADYVSSSGIENLVLGATSRHSFIRFKASSISSSVSKAAPDFCNVYIISKGKVSTMRNSSRPAPYASPLLEQIHNLRKERTESAQTKSRSLREEIPMKAQSANDYSFRPPFNRGRHLYGGDTTDSETDISFVSSEGPCSDGSSFLYDAMDDVSIPGRPSTSSEVFGSVHWGSKLSDHSSFNDLMSVSRHSFVTPDSPSLHHLDEVETEIRRLKLELKQTMNMYNTACKEALISKQKATELHLRRLDEEQKLEEARLGQEAALSVAEKERAKCQAAMEQAEKAQRIAVLEYQRRVEMEMRSGKEAEELGNSMGGFHMEDARYRKYTIEEIEAATECFSKSRKIGEGGYGPVFKCYLDHTPVAIKVLHPDAVQGRSQFRKEVEVLSCIRHPNMVLLLGACSEYGCLVYEYMANGSLEDCLLRRSGTPALTWQHRFRIAAEIATGLLFLHQTKPEPIVHRDLKPGNVLLDHNFVSKISDVGLARLVPAVAENMTECHMTSMAGTFCYIDPEYQQTGMLGVKSDVYSLGIVLLQLITAKLPMAIAHHVSVSIEKGTFEEVLDSSVPDWPVQEAMDLAMIAIQCCEMRRKDRPNLSKVVLPKLLQLKDFAMEKSRVGHWHCGGGGGGGGGDPSLIQSHASQEEMSDLSIGHSRDWETHSEASSIAATNS
ncbi:hypothetical protein SAY87_012309 [Trapa incisa]|uniref:Protein kinase domain-containing protein n=1 Tax=Trapa incisa TaxID=236973 RepID=A0AAN7GT74_9MYRT|nr:hypothetical protein SAY87_012309 [Trapa incisa]